MTQALVRAVLDALSDDPVIGHRLAVMAPEERVRIEQRCVAAAKDASA